MEKLNNKIKKHKGISLLFVLLILGVMLTAVLVISDIMIRQSRIMRNIAISERAYFAAETGVEETLYEINKARTKNITTPGEICGNGICEGSETVGNCPLDCNGGNYTGLFGCWCQANCNNCQINYDGGNATWQIISLTENLIDTNNPLEVTLSPGQSLQLNLDMKGATYPNKAGDDIQFERIGGGASELIVFKENKSTGAFIQYGPDSNSPTTTDLDTANYYYKFRIYNPSNSGASVLYRIKPLGGENLAVGVRIIASAACKDMERRIEANNPKWQIYGQ